MDQFRGFLTDWLASNGWSASQLARVSGLRQNTISRWTGMNPTRPTTENLEKLAPVIGVAYEDLLRMCGYLPSIGLVAVDDSADPALAEVIAIWPRLTEERRDSIRTLAVAGARTADNPAHSVAGNRSARRVTRRTPEHDDDGGERVTRRYPHPHGVLSRAAA